MYQGVHATIAVAMLVDIIYAVSEGFLDSIPVTKVGLFVSELIESLDREPCDYLKLFAREKAMTPEVKAALEAVLKRLSVKSA
jgi:F0F1-type ATP synthase alpha subunit